MGVGVGGVVNYANVSSGTASDVVAYGGIGGPYEYVSFFSVLNWFKNGEQGAWYDPSDLTTLFQDSAGTTPVTLSPMEQPVGLMLDKSKGLALGAELYSTTGWSLGTNWSFSGQNLVYSGSANTIAAQSPTALLQTNTWYKYTLTIVGAARLYYGATTSYYLLTGTYSLYLSTDTNTAISFRSEGVPTTISNLSIKQIAGNHASQATPGNRPLLSARVNLLTKTEAISVANGYIIDANSTLNINAGIAPNGTLTASKFNSTSNTNTNQFYYTAPAGQVAGMTYTFSHYLKLGTGGTGAIRLTCGGVATTFNLLTGLVISGVGRITPVGNGWFFCSVDSVAGNIAVDNIGTFTIGQGHYVWGADLRPTNSGGLLPPYQRVNTATDYDTVGFPLYLKCNGSSSFMSTNSINFTATDKMTVVTGVRKLSGNNRIIELSVDSDSNSGCFRMETSPVANSYRTQVGNVTARKLYDFLTYIPPINNVFTSQMAFSPANYLDARINGVIPSTISKGLDATLQTINFGSYPIYLFSKGGLNNFLEGYFYGAIIRGAQSDTNSVVQTEQYMAKQTGITF